MYVYQHNGIQWIEEQTLIASDAREGLWFGVSIVLDGDALVVGGPMLGTWNVSEGIGAAYVFRRRGSTWVEEAILRPSDSEAGAHFGWAIDMDGPRIVVGAPCGSICGGAASGAAYVFELEGGVWVEKERLQLSRSVANDRFGTAVSMEGDRVVVGALTGGDVPGVGAVALFKSNGVNWTHVQTLVASDGEQGDEFGSTIAIGGEVVVVGAPGFDGYYSNWGAVYVFSNESDCNRNGIPDDCEKITGPDFDANGNINQLDFAAFHECMSTPYGRPAPLSSACALACLLGFDADGDDDVDLRDYAVLQRLFTP